MFHVSFGMVAGFFILTSLLYSVENVEGELTFVSLKNYNNSLQVTTRNGIVQGRENRTEYGRAFFSYRKIPFAKPPLGDLRFRPPRPITPWKRVLDATKENVGCVETGFHFVRFAEAGQEDCLYLNVYTPQLPFGAQKSLPVLVWIYGGGYIEGNSSSYLYGPDNLMEHDVIVVTFNYRLGIFGFLSTFDDASPGNYGLKDQLAVLKWIKFNIKYFGGDPKRVTIVGQSAGATSVMMHMASKRSRGLFHRAIALSGSSLCSWAMRRKYREVTEDVAYALGVDLRNSTKFVEELRRKSLKELINAEKKVINANILQIYFRGLVFTPTVEPETSHAFITETTYHSFLKGNVAKVPLIIGTTASEFVLLSMVYPLIKPALFYIDLGPGILAKLFETHNTNINRNIGIDIIRRYFKSGTAMDGQNYEIINFLNDALMFMPVMETVRLLHRHMPVYNYLFSHHSKDIEKFVQTYVGFNMTLFLKGVGHGEEIPLLWKSLNYHLHTIDDRLVSARFVKLLTNFVVTGNPTPESDSLLQNVIWPPVTHFDNRTCLDIGTNLNLIRNYKDDYVTFWIEKIFKKYSVHYN